MNDDKILEVKPSVKWVGVLDYDIVTFDVVMNTDYGSTYNSYFIDADKKVIIDTTKETFWETYEKKVRAVTEPTDIDYIILNHTEPDHSGNLANLLNMAPKAKVVATASAIKYLHDLFEFDFESIVVKDGDTLDLGNKTLRFISAPNLHWPDTMYTYLEEDKILFSCDSFGCHFADARMFDSEVDDFSVAFRYYFDVIIKPFSRFMLNALEKIDPLEIDTICTGHGPILRENMKQMVELTRLWSQKFVLQPQKNKVFIPFVSAYKNTGRIAEEIARGIHSEGNTEVELMNIEHVSLGELEIKMIQSNAVIVGSPTINQNILLPIYKLFSVINPYRDHHKLAGAFGSYGWSGENRKLLELNLKALKFNYFGDGLFIKFSLSEEEKAQAFEYGLNFATELQKRTKS